METAAVIGATGFIGDYLVSNLSSKKNIYVQAIYKNTPPVRKLTGVEYFQLDGAKDPQSLYQVIKQASYLIILARPDEKLIKNIILSGVTFKKIIYASSILIYPNSSQKLDESSKSEPSNDYERQKIKEERLLTKFVKSSGNKLTIARLTNVYGDKKSRALIHWILSALIEDKSFKINNRGKPVRDFIFVEDAAKYLELLIFLDQKEHVEIYNVCTGFGLSINKLILQTQAVTGKKIKLQTGDTTDEKLSVIGDNGKIIKATGYKPKYNLESGLKKAYQNYLKN